MCYVAVVAAAAHSPVIRWGFFTSDGFGRCILRLCIGLFYLEGDKVTEIKLTPKQERFAQCVADGMTQADAYRVAYDCAGDTKPETVQANASRLMADSMVSARVQQLRDQLAERSLWTRLDSIKALAEVARNPASKGAETVAAVKELNAMHGWNKQVIEHSGQVIVNTLSSLIDELSEDGE